MMKNHSKSFSMMGYLKKKLIVDDDGRGNCFLGTTIKIKEVSRAQTSSQKSAYRMDNFRGMSMSSVSMSIRSDDSSISSNSNRSRSSSIIDTNKKNNDSHKHKNYKIVTEENVSNKNENNENIHTDVDNSQANNGNDVYVYVSNGDDNKKGWYDDANNNNSKQRKSDRIDTSGNSNSMYSNNENSDHKNLVDTMPLSPRKNIVSFWKNRQSKRKFNKETKQHIDKNGQTQESKQEDYRNRNHTKQDGTLEDHGEIEQQKLLTTENNTPLASLPALSRIQRRRHDGDLDEDKEEGTAGDNDDESNDSVSNYYGPFNFGEADAVFDENSDYGDEEDGSNANNYKINNHNADEDSVRERALRKLANDAFGIQPIHNIAVAHRSYLQGLHQNDGSSSSISGDENDSTGSNGKSNDRKVKTFASSHYYGARGSSITNCSDSSSGSISSRDSFGSDHSSNSYNHHEKYNNDAYDKHVPFSLPQLVKSLDHTKNDLLVVQTNERYQSEELPYADFNSPAVVSDDDSGTNDRSSRVSADIQSDRHDWDNDVEYDTSNIDKSDLKPSRALDDPDDKYLSIQENKPLQNPGLSFAVDGDTATISDDESDSSDRVSTPR